MDIKKLNEELNKFIIDEMSPAYNDPSKSIEEYFNHIDYAKYHNLTKPRIATINGLRIPSETISHTEKHNLSLQDWKNLIDNYNIEQDRIKYGKKSVKQGKASICKLKIDNKCYCYIVEEFSGNVLPILTTFFYNNENSIDSWIKQQK